jgi:epoxyqueuosine reductase
MKIVEWGYSEDLSTPTDVYDRYLGWDCGPLGYMKKDRIDKKSLVTTASAAVVVMFSYLDFARKLSSFYLWKNRKNNLTIASFVLAFEGEDYHHVIRRYLWEAVIHLGIEEVARVAVDSSPVPERSLAMKALSVSGRSGGGRGWIGKSGMFIHPRHGSFTLLGEILLSRKLTAEEQQRLGDFLGSMPSTGNAQDVEGECGDCCRCVLACPTQAIDPLKRTVNVHRCLSCWTLEIRSPMVKKPSSNHSIDEFFGCDRCLLACPWNKIDEDGGPLPEKYLSAPKFHLIYDFFFDRPTREIISSLEGMSQNQFRKLFKGTSFERTGRLGVLKNLCVENALDK